MEKFSDLQNSLFTQLSEISIFNFVVNLALSALLGYILGEIYKKYGHVLSNRAAFSRNFILLTMTTMFIITIVQSSLALSLGLIGALSIVRFRAAIKEPEELIYLFIAIAFGLGLGANQRLLTIVAFITIVGIIWVVGKSHNTKRNQNVFLTVTSNNPLSCTSKVITNILKKNCQEYVLKRLDQTDKTLEAMFLVEFEKETSLESVEQLLREKDQNIKVSFLDHSGMITH